MVQVFYGFAGDNVEITKRERRTYSIPFLDYEICNSLHFLSVEEKFKVIKYIIKISGKPDLFHKVFKNIGSKEKKLLLAHCKEQEKSIPKDFDFEIY